MKRQLKAQRLEMALSELVPELLQTGQQVADRSLVVTFQKMIERQLVR